MSPRDLVYVGHMLDMARKVADKAHGLSRQAYDADENLRLALIYLIQVRRRIAPLRGQRHEPVAAYATTGTRQSLVLAVG